MTKAFKYLFLTASLLILASCSTTRVLQDGEYRLAANKIDIENDKHFNGRSLEAYVNQRPHWSPFLYVYNWQNGKGKGWDKFVSKIGVAPVVYDSESIGSSESNIINHLEYIGYFDSKVDASVRVKKRKVKVTYNVTLGKQYPISELTWDVPDGEFREEFDKDTTHIGIKVGEPLAESVLEAETVRSSKYFRDHGFFGFNKNQYFFEADTLISHDSAALHMSIREYQRSGTPAEARPLNKYYIDNVDIMLPVDFKVRNKVLTGLTLMRPGEEYCEEDISRTYERLSALKIFNNVNINVNEKASDKVDCEISLTKAKLQGFKLNAEASVNSTGLFGISPQLTYYHKNIFRGGEWLNLSFMGNFQFKFKDNIRSNEFGVSAGLSIPKFLGMPYKYFKGAIPRTDMNLSYNYQSRPEYTRNIISANYGYTGSIKNFSYKIYPAQLNIVHLFKLSDDFYNSIKADPFLRNSYQNHFDFGLGGMLQYTTNTDPNPQTSFFYTRLNFDVDGNLLSAFKKYMEKDDTGAGLIWGTPFSQFVRFEATVGQTWRFGAKDGQAIATRLLAGAGFAYGNSGALPFEKQFYGGGASSLRGWQARTVGPGSAARSTAFVIPNQTGDMKLEANIEYRFDIFWKIEGAAFVDAGNVWNMPVNLANEGSSDAQFHFNSFYKDIAADWGLGIRADFSFLVVRLDWGMKVHDPSRDNPWVGPAGWFKRDGYAIHFGVGYPF